MKAMVLTGHGGPECLELRHDVPTPVPRDGEVLVRVRAAAVNNTDINTRVGWYAGGGWTGSFTFPRIQGIDGCGVIESVGAGVASSRRGERVLVEPCWRAPDAAFSTARFVGSEVDGTFAEYIVVPSRHAHSIKSTWTDLELATLPCSYSTSENMLRRASVTTGERVLVTGASGGVGSAAVQLAVARGAEVIAVASPSKSDAVYAIGATTVIDRDSISTIDDVDAVIDVVGGTRWHHLLDTLRPGGRLATAGAIDDPVVSLDLRTLYLHDITLIGCTVLDADTFPSLVRRVEADQIRPLVAAVYPLEQLAEAQQFFLGKGFVGKIAISV